MGATLYHGGTVISLDAEDRIGSCLLVEDGRIRAVLDSPAECAGLKDLRRVDLEGKTLIPGFNDNHMHLSFLGDSLEALHFPGKNEAEIVALLREKYPEPARNEVLLGYDWDYPACVDPRKEALDEAFPSNPVILAQYGGHNLWVNSVTLGKMKIDRNTPQPAAGLICRDEEGEPTGILKDLEDNSYLNAWFIRCLLSYRLNRENYLRAIRRCSEFGITSAQDNTWSFVAMGAIARLYREGRLTTRLSCWSHGESDLLRLLFTLRRFKPGWYAKGPVKYFIDGTFSGKTAWLKEPYPGDEANHGLGKPREKLIAMLEKHVRKGEQCAFHALGDRAVAEFLDALEELSARYPGIPGLRLRLEHAQLIDAEDMPRIKKLGVLVCAQPSALNDPGKDRSILGEARAARAYPYASLLKAGIPLCFGSDAPGEKSFDPFVGIHYAVNREGAERIGPREALKCYTTASAFAEFREKEKGSLSPGLVADFLVLSENPLAIPPERIKEIRVEKTYVDGELVYEASGGGKA